MEANKDLFRLIHIKECIDKVEKLVEILKTLEGFETQWVEQDALIRNFEIIGEASNHISEDLVNRYPGLPWKEMRGMRNFIVHEYFGLQLDTIWDTAVNDIPILGKQIQKIIQDFKE